MSGSNILFVLTGSIAAYKACDAISRLVQRGHRVRCAMSEAAGRFVGTATLEGLTGAPVATGIFAEGRALDHINLTRWAEVVVVAPATANTINRFAAGLADDLPGALFLAGFAEATARGTSGLEESLGQTPPVQGRGREAVRGKRWLIAPAMNPAMWSHPATQAAVVKLKTWGVEFVEAEAGRTACGEIGEGRLAEPEALVAAIEAAARPEGKRWRVLVTAGGTAEPVDDVRVLTNTSTGATGAAIATHLARAGHDVVLLRARHAVAADGPCREEFFQTFADLEAQLKRLLASERFDVVIHAAAVSDYAIEAVLEDGGVAPSVKPGKLASGGAPRLQLRPNPRLVDRLREWSPTPLRVVAFKLTSGADPEASAEAVRRLFAHSQADFVVHNDLRARVSADDFPSEIHRAAGGSTVRCSHRTALPRALEGLLDEALAHS